LAIPCVALADTSVTGAVGGRDPSGTSFNGVPIHGLNAGLGVKIVHTGSTRGHVSIGLLGTSLAGLEQRIVIEGEPNAGQRTATNIPSYSGTCSVNMGDRTPPTPGVPFTATVTTDENEQGTFALVIGAGTLPGAVINEGSQTIR
jgi:hypothetical protein